MRLGSGRERSRCIMQFSLAAGSDRAAGGERAWAGLGWRGCQQQVPLGCPTMGNVARKQTGGAASSFPLELAIIPMPHEPYSVLI